MKIMNSYKIKSATLSILAALLALTSCLEKGSDEIAGIGTSRFRFRVTDHFAQVVFESEPQTKTIVSINRDAISVADLASTTSVEFEMNQAVLDEFNEKRQEEAEEAEEDFEPFELLPATAYEIVGVTGAKFEFAAGEFEKRIAMTLDPGVLDLSKKYALPFVLKNPSGNYGIGISGSYAIIEILVKNQYDGIYEESGTLEIPDTAPIALSADVELSTTGAASCVTVAGSSYFGNPNILYSMTVNPDNSVTIASVPGAAVAIYPIDPPASYDPDTETFTLHYEYLNSSGIKRSFHTQLVKK